MPVNNQNWLDLLKQCFFINLAATVVIVAFNTATVGLQTIFSPEYLISSFVHSNCIGTLISFVIFYISPRWIDNSSVVRLAKVSVSIFIATFIGITIARLISSLIFPVLANQGLIPRWQNFVFALGIAFMVGFGVYFFEISQSRLRQKILDAEKARTLATEAQLASLESRVHPHFLFNTLNSIAALIRDDPILAEKMVEKLSVLLRYSLDSNSRGLVSLTQELEITKKYLEIEKVRFDRRLTYNIDANADFSFVKLPPLALQTLVENSIKHVAAKRSGTTEIKIAANINGSQVVIEVSDNGPGFRADALLESHGLDLLQRRLITIFGDAAQLEIGNASVQLHIPYKFLPESAKTEIEDSQLHTEAFI